MARNSGRFEKRCGKCGAVKIDGYWSQSLFLTSLPEVTNLPKDFCASCSGGKVILAYPSKLTLEYAAA